MFIQNEPLTPDGVAVEFELAQKFKPGTVKVLFDDKLAYECYEKADKTAIIFDVAPAATRSIVVSYYSEDEQNTLNQFRYITPSQAKAMSRVTAITAATDADLERLIRETEMLIDEYIGFFYRKLDEDNGQLLMFPRLQDLRDTFDDTHPVEYSGVPQDVTRAALFGLENIILSGDVSADTGVGEIVSERLGDYSYTLSQSSGSSTKTSGTLLGKRSRSLLDKYQRRYREMKIDDDRRNGVLNSRQQFARDHY